MTRSVHLLLMPPCSWTLCILFPRAGLALSVKQHLGCEQEIWYYICCKWLGQQEAYVVAQATQARRSGPVVLGVAFAVGAWVLVPLPP